MSISFTPRPYWVFLLALILVFGYPVGYFIFDSRSADNEIPASISDSTKDGVGAYILNLDRSKERYHYVKDRVQALGLPLERIEAVDGSALSAEEISRNVDLATYKALLGNLPKRGTIGCSLSHMKAWQAFLDSPLQFAVIFEDDVSFDPHRVKTTIDELVKNSELWDLVTFQIYRHGFPMTLKRLSNDQHLSVYLGKVMHAGAYILNRKAAQALLEKALPIKMPIDHYFTRAWEFDIKFTGIEHPRIVQQSFGDSDIGATEKLPPATITVADGVTRRLYRLQTYVIRFLYNLKVYVITLGTGHSVLDTESHQRSL